ncbi:MAG: hypothetical protein KGN02_01745 [bacterium]|nr:hypothetical protein [bacterium]
MRSLLATATVALTALFVSGSPAIAREAAHATPCAAATLAASRTHARLTPCTAPYHRAIVETTYYQNASRAGGTALAAYPEVRVRYGILRNAELFYDASSEIAKSGVAGAGIYTMTHPGIGVKLHLADLGNAALSLSAESHPPLSALANTELVPMSDVHLSANWSGIHAMQYTLSAGMLNYASTDEPGHRVSPLLAFSATHALSSRNFVTGEFALQSASFLGASAQSSATLAFAHVWTNRVLVNLELGSTFNQSGDSKPHYLGFGFIVH